MSTEAPDQNLHLPSLVIENFRGIDKLTIPRLGRVTLLTGKNGVGKSTVLDAVRVYAARGRVRVLNEILRYREELVSTVDEDGDEIPTPDWGALFHGRRFSLNERLTIGSTVGADTLKIRLADPAHGYPSQLALFESTAFEDDELFLLEIEFQGSRQTLPNSVAREIVPAGFGRRLSPRARFLIEGTELPREILCESIGPGVLNNQDVARFLDHVALTDHEDRAVEALNLVADGRVERVATVGVGTKRGLVHARHVVVRFKGEEYRIPLKSLGDGAVRLLSVALALANSSDGFLLIDEAENGIHHSIQAKFWKMILQTAQRNNVQVVATTHSWDCVAGFAQAATDLEDVEGVLYRVQRNIDNFRAVEYTESELLIAAEHGIEVR